MLTETVTIWDGKQMTHQHGLVQTTIIGLCAFLPYANRWCGDDCHRAYLGSPCASRGLKRRLSPPFACRLCGLVPLV